MGERNRVWLGLGAALLTSTSLVTGTPAVGTAPVSATQSTNVDGTAPSGDRPARTARVQLAAGEGGEGGEGGEAGGGGTAPDLARSDSAYLTQLALISGQLEVGVELYGLGEVAASAAHLKHTEDELYATLKPALEKRAAPGFEKELEALAQRVQAKARQDEVLDAKDAVLDGIAVAEGVVGNPTPHEIGEVIHSLVREAAEDYGKAVADGKVVEPDEYQDGLGFVLVAEDWVQRLEASGADPAVIAEIRKQVAIVKPAWPSVLPPKSAPVDPSVIFGAAARIEIAALGLKD